MDVYVREQLHVLDYKDNIVDTIFNSDDHRTPGYAYNISITEANTGYSDLKFDMPNVIYKDTPEERKNPKLALLTPLVKLRYRRQVYYIGEKPITVREPEGCGDTTVYIDKTYSNKYPDNVIEDYVMDYIVQPVDKKRDVLKLTTTFTAIDYPRFNLSKKRVGLTIDNDTLTRDEWSLFKNEPMDQPGTIKYQKWTQALSNSAGNSAIPTEFNPATARQYPLNKTDIVKLMADVASWPYGLLATAFYWPIVETARFEGVLYKKGGYLVLQLYDFYNLTTEGVDPELYVDRYSWEWTQLYEVDSYLCPNNAKNYLHHILEGTNWTVAKRPDGTDDVDIVQSYIPNPRGSTQESTLADDTCNISVSGSNCYNAITSVCQGLQLYPVYDCINRTVALRQFAGKNYGLTYALGQNISSNSSKADGEKVITKLYCSGGKDYNGDTNINIGTAERTYVKTFAGFYKSVSQLPTQDVEGYWAIVDPGFKDSDFQSTTYDQNMNPITKTVHDDLVKNYWVASDNRQVYAYDNTTGSWILGTKSPETGNWSVSVNGVEFIIDPITGTQAPWDPNDDMYIMSRSPYGTNYILNLKWAYQNNWITKEEILELYQYEQQINDLDYMFMDKYIEDRNTTQIEYNKAVNSYDISQDEFESTLLAMENKYYTVDGDYSEGYTYCFHTAPQGTYRAYNSDLKKQTCFIKLFHCYGCGKTEAIAPSGSSAGANRTRCPYCSSTDVTNDEIFVPTFDIYRDEMSFNDSDYPYGTDTTRSYPGYQYNPHLKGYYQRLVTSLDRIDASDSYDIHWYEGRVRMIVTGQTDEALPFTGGTIYGQDGYNYKLDGIYVKSASGQIDVWNTAVRKYTKAYGEMLDHLRVVNAMLDRIKALQELYDKWEAEQDRLHALIQEKFGDYLVEGNYTNDEQPYIGLLFNEGLEASDKYSTPEITYNLDVIDSSGLIEYRRPMIYDYTCNACGYTTHRIIDECPKCGNRLITTTHDIYNDLVKMLHSVGQIVPKAGDYCTIVDEPMGMYGVPGLITEITRYLDNPMSNKIQLDTGYTDDEELVGNIITATNTVLSNADIYARTSVLKSDGTLDPTSVRNSLDNSNADITIVGTDGSILLNGSGLRATDPNDPHRAMKYAGNGIFNTTNLNTDNGEATVWEKMITPEGINATYIRSGTIDTDKLTIMSGLYGKVVLDQYGLVVKDRASRSAHITQFNTTSAKNDASYASNWGTTNNIASFIGVDAANNPLIYTKGFLYAQEGSNIANWITSNQGFYHLSGTTKDLWLSPGGISGSVNNHSGNFAFYANGDFGVTTGGKLYARGAEIDGDSKFTGYIHITDGSSDMNTGEVGGWGVNGSGLSRGEMYLSSAGISGKEVNVGNGYKSSGPWSIFSNYNFGVTTSGTLYAKNAYVGGTIYATAGLIGGCSIKDGSLWIEDAHIDTLSVSKITGGNNGADITFNGTIRCQKLYASNSGTIGGFTIGGSSLTKAGGGHGTVGIYTDGRISFGNDYGWINSGSAGTWINGNSYTYPCYITDSYTHTQEDSKDAIITRTTWGRYCLRADTTFGTNNTIASGTVGGYNKANSDIYMYASSGSIRANAETNIWLRAKYNLVVEGENHGVYICSDNSIHLGDNTGSVIPAGIQGCPAIKIGAQGISRVDMAGTVTLNGMPFMPSSSKNMKTNITQITIDEQNQIYDIVKNMAFYSYNYKPKYLNDSSLYHGFIIEDIENTVLKSYLHFTQSKVDKNIKDFNPIELSKMNLMLIHTLQQKIEALVAEVEQLKKEKTN